MLHGGADRALNRKNQRNPDLIGTAGVQAARSGHLLLVGFGVGMSARKGHLLLVGFGVGMSATSFVQFLFTGPVWDMSAVLANALPAKPVIRKDVNNRVLIMLLFEIWCAFNFKCSPQYDSLLPRS